MPEHTWWFPAKRYGWGWGLPCAWQGWVVLALFVAPLGASALVFPPTLRMPEFLLSVFFLTAMLVAVCFMKGEPPSWRWGDEP